MSYESIFEKYYKKEDFQDRKVQNKESGIDVIIPIFNTNELFEKNLYSIYREIPINRLLIGNAGSTDGSIAILKKFPRVEIFDQSNYKSLGYCIAELISKVQTEWFVYLHADVYLPEKWYDIMIQYQDNYDWFECDRHMTTLIEFDPNIKNMPRSYSGSQMGRTEAFENIIPKIDDDHLYRNEDIVLQDMILAEGYTYGRVLDTLHYHQVMNKRGEKEPKFKKVLIERFTDKGWEIRTYEMQVRGIIKYTQPKPHLIRAVNKPLRILQQNNSLDINEFKNWVKNTNEVWLKYINLQDPIFQKILKKLKSVIDFVFNKLIG